MPLRTWDTKADFDAAYDFGAEPGGIPGGTAEVRLHYSRSALWSFFRDVHAPTMADKLGWTPPGGRIVIVGAGFGWTIEALELLGYTEVVGIDTSTWVQSVQGQNENADIDAAIQRAGLDPTVGRGSTVRDRCRLLAGSGARAGATRPVLDEDASDNGSRRRILQQLTGNPNTPPAWVITESVLESLDDTEAVMLATGLRGWGASLVHVVLDTPEDVPLDGYNSGYNWKTLAEWKALLPADTILSFSLSARHPELRQVL